MQNNIGQSSLLQAYIKNSGLASNIAQNNPVQAKPDMPSPVYQTLEADAFQSSDKEKSKKRKIAKIALLSAVGLTVGVGVIAAFRHKGGLGKSIKETFRGVKNFFSNETKKAGDKLHGVKESAESMSDLQKGADNITNIKDSVARKFFKKIPGYQKFDDWSSNLYRKTSLSATSKSYSKAKTAIDQADDTILEALKKSDIDEKSATRIRELLAKRKSAVADFTDPASIKTRFDKLNSSMQNLEDDAWEALKGIKDEGLKNGAKRLSRESIAEGRLKECKKLHSSLIGNFKNAGLSEKEAAELSELLKATGSADVTAQASKAEKLFKKAYSKEGRDLFEKLRDINFGCAPTDFMGMAGTVGLLGVYAAQADTKEERVGVTLTTGIPLLATLGTTIVATSKMVSGIKALALGSITGMFANVIGSKVNKQYQKAHNTENAPKTIVTLDDYINTAKDMTAKIYI